MAKKYTRKQVHDLDELDKEQARIQLMCHRMEHDFLDNVLNPQQMAASMLGSFLAKKGKQSGASVIQKLTGVAGGGLNGKTIVAIIAGIMKKPAVATFAKGVGRSWLRWQAFNLAYFLGKKAVAALKEKQKRNNKIRKK